MMSLPKISIVTPSYNQGQFLEETIRSVLNQEYSNLEYIVIDGGSKDDSLAIIQKYAHLITYWISEQDNGQSNAINKGLTKVTGDIVTWINSDDLLLPGALKKVAGLFGSLSTDVAVIHGGTVVFDHHSEQEVYTYGRASAERYLSGMAFSQPAAFFRKTYLDQVGHLNESLHYGMDYDLFARLASVSRFAPVKELFSKYRLHDDSKSVAQGERFRQDWNKVFLSLCRHIGWEHIIDQLYFYAPEMRKEECFLSYQFAPNQNVVRGLDSKKVLFYFLADLLLHYYWYDRRKEARMLLAKLRKGFPAEWLAEDRRVTTVVNKLRLPEFVLQPLKKVRQSFRKGSSK